MNHVFKVLWNKTLGCWVVASELAKQHTGKTSNKRGATVSATPQTNLASIAYPLRALALAVVTLMGTSTAWAGLVCTDVNGSEGGSTAGGG